MNPLQQALHYATVIKDFLGKTFIDGPVDRTRQWDEMNQQKNDDLIKKLAQDQNTTPDEYLSRTPTEIPPYRKAAISVADMIKGLLGKK
jgi:hypothetical protein